MRSTQLILAESLASARSARTEPYNRETFVGQVVRLIVPDGRDAGGLRPESFLVEQVPNWNLRTHFHLQHQFQLFVAGGGWLGRNPIAPLTVHYATPHSAYGPLLAGEQGISYLTMRVVSDPGAWYLPESRARLRTDGPKRQVHAHPSVVRGADALRTLADAEAETLIPLAEDGLGAWIVRLPPHARTPAPAGAPLGAGRFHVVTQGGAAFPSGSETALATVFASAEDGFDLQAGPDGAEIVVMQFPAMAVEGAVCGSPQAA